MNHTGPYTITMISKRNGRVDTFVRKTFKSAENVLTSYFLRENLTARFITNAQGAVFSIYAFDTRPAALERARKGA